MTSSVLTAWTDDDADAMDTSSIDAPEDASHEYQHAQESLYDSIASVAPLWADDNAQASYRDPFDSVCLSSTVPPVSNPDFVAQMHSVKREMDLLLDKIAPSKPSSKSPGTHSYPLNYLIVVTHHRILPCTPMLTSSASPQAHRANATVTVTKASQGYHRLFR
jgi:hypothetical protein